MSDAEHDVLSKVKKVPQGVEVTGDWVESHTICSPGLEFTSCLKPSITTHLRIIYQSWLSILALPIISQSWLSILAIDHSKTIMCWNTPKYLFFQSGILVQLKSFNNQFNGILSHIEAISVCLWVCRTIHLYTPKWDDSGNGFQKPGD